MGEESFLKWQERDYDLIIIGGGINGAAIARDASLRGLQVILFEKNDFACGASSKSSKLIHGGLRYLEQREFGLVRESLQERSILLRTIPHQVKLIPFVFPVFEGDKRPLWMIKCGLYLYDFLSPNDVPKHHHLTVKEITTLFPALKTDHLKGGCLYYDAQMLDHRIVFENLVSAQKAGCLALNYTAITGLYQENGQVKGVYYQNSKTGKQGLCQGKAVINATGAWSNSILKMDSPVNYDKVYPTKGVHLILPQVSPKYALTLTAPQDSRVFFLIPWNGYSLLGTTDTAYREDPDNLKVSDEDIDYLLSAINHYFPHDHFCKNSILAEYAGLRPLPLVEETAPSLIKRKANMIVSTSGLISLIGGKYTTYRKISENAVDLVIRQINQKDRFSPCQTAQTPLFDLIDKKLMKFDTEEMTILATEYRLTFPQIEHLIANYGSAIWKILALIKALPLESLQICPDHPHIYAELTYTIQNEQVIRLEDWFERRTNIAYLPCKGLKCLQAVSEKFSQLLQWDQNTKHQNIQSYCNHLPNFKF
jgi:glycerol-3-phosphate dehydrogenase